MSRADTELGAYVLMSVPNCTEPVWLPRDTVFQPVSPAVIDMMQADADGDGWSKPVQVKLSRLENGLVEMCFRTVP